MSNTNANNSTAVTEQARLQQTKSRITSLFIYWVPLQTTSQEVKRVIDGFLGGDAVRRVDFVIRKDRKTKKSFRTVFIHFNSWPDTDISRQVEKDVLAGKTVEINYSETGFWKCTENKMPEPRDLRSPSIFMPRVNSDTTEEQIKDTFTTAFHGPDEENRSSHVTRINLIPKTDKNGNPYNTAYIHFAEWEMTEPAKHFFHDAGTNGAHLRWGDGRRDTWLCILNRNTMGSGTTIDKRNESTATPTKKGPYISVERNLAENIPTTPAAPPSSPDMVPLPVLKRQVAIGRVESTDGSQSISPISHRSLAEDLDLAAVETSQRRGISNVPAWIAKQREAAGEEMV